MWSNTCVIYVFITNQDMVKKVRMLIEKKTPNVHDIVLVLEC